MAIGGIAYLHHTPTGGYRAGTPLDLIAPAAIVALSASAWLRLSATSQSPIAQRALRVVVLGPVWLASLAILVLGVGQHVSTMALGFAAATVMLGVARASLRTARTAGPHRVTPTPGGNRRADGARQPSPAAR